MLPLQDFKGFTKGMPHEGPLLEWCTNGNWLPAYNAESWRYTFCTWAMEDSDYATTIAEDACFFTAYFRWEATDGRIPLQCYDSFEFHMPLEMSKKLSECEKKWRTQYGQYDVGETHAILFPFLREVLEKVYGFSEEDVVVHEKVAFYISGGTRDVHMSAQLNLLDERPPAGILPPEDTARSFPPGSTGRRYVPWVDRFEKGTKKFWRPSKAA